MKLRYKGDFNLSSGISFKAKDLETIYEVSSEKGAYLLKTFKDIFEEIKEEKPKEKIEEIKTEEKTEIKEPKVTIKRTTKPKAKTESK